MDGQLRKDIQPGIEVDIVLKKDQRSGNLTNGIVKDILTNSPRHPHGIKVRLEDRQDDDGAYFAIEMPFHYYQLLKEEE